MAQTVGYLVGGLGPLAVGALHDWTGGWRVPIGALLVLHAPLLAAGVVAGRPRMVRGAG
jgi:CP family cyanate transporter-like MFS transporter